MELCVGPRVRVELIREDPPSDRQRIAGAADVVTLLGSEARRWDREHFLTLMLDHAHGLIGIEEVSVGSATGTLVHPREVFKGLILANADAFIVVHNHQASATPSPEDLEITRRLKAAADLLAVRFIDHIIIGRIGCVSFVEDGYW